MDGINGRDTFFTDKSLHSMITEKHLGLDALYECHVGSSVEHAIEHVSGDLESRLT